MRLLLVPAVCCALQGAPEIAPRFQKFDRLEVSCTVKTEIKSSNGRDSKYEIEMSVTAEAEKADGDGVTFDCGVGRLRLTGVHEGRRIDADWSKSAGAGRGELPAGLTKALEKGWKLTLAGKKGIQAGEGFLAVGDVIPVFNPGALLGFPVPPPFDRAVPDKPWEVKGMVFPHYGTYGLRATGTLDFVEGDVARLSARLKFQNASDEEAGEFAASVKGDGFASLEYDVKRGRPVKGATSAKLLAAQGGLKREVSQVVEFEVRK